MDANYLTQHNYFTGLIRDGDAKHRKGGTDSLNINELHRMACDYIGVDREWNRVVKLNQSTKGCPACAKDILQEALVCQTNIVRFYENMLTWVSTLLVLLLITVAVAMVAWGGGVVSSSRSRAEGGGDALPGGMAGMASDQKLGEDTGFLLDER